MRQIPERKRKPPKINAKATTKNEEHKEVTVSNFAQEDSKDSKKEYIA